MNSQAPLCPRCQSIIAPDAPGGICPACALLAVAQATDPSQNAAAAVPTVEEIAAAFPELEIVDWLGHGGMGVVFKARQPRLDRLVALKILPPALAVQPGFPDRFAREARALARLNHPHIVAVHDFGEREGFCYLLMEYVDGVNLREALREGITPEQALALVPQICEALQFAHDRGVLHRDIKPENILLDTTGTPKLADFGIAKLGGDSGDASSRAPSETALTQTGAVLGTAAYMAPEQIERPSTVDHRADIYSLGVVFYEMLTGELPLGRFPAPSKKASVSPGVDEVVLRALEKEREHRQQSATEFKTQVEASHATQPGASTPAVGGRVRACVLAAAGCFLLALVFSPLWMLFHEGRWAAERAGVDARMENALKSYQAAEFQLRQTGDDPGVRRDYVRADEALYTAREEQRRVYDFERQKPVRAVNQGVVVVALLAALGFAVAALRAGRGGGAPGRNLAGAGWSMRDLLLALTVISAICVPLSAAWAPLRSLGSPAVFAILPALFGVLYGLWPDPSPHGGRGATDADNPWTRRLFWLAVLAFGLPIVLIVAGLVIPAAAQNGHVLAITSSEIRIALGVLAAVVGLMIWATLRSQASPPPGVTWSPWPRRLFVALLALLCLPGGVLVAVLVWQSGRAPDREQALPAPMESPATNPRAVP
jgi:tRNA A-37 threonylcarbamoyl transferase component Bud32